MTVQPLKLVEDERPLGFSLAVEEAELACVGIALVFPDRIDEVSLRPGEFFSPRMQVVWSVLLELRSAGEAIDPLIVVARIEAKGIKAITLADLSGVVARSFERELIADYADIVRRASVTRRCVVALDEVLTKGKAGKLADSELLDEAIRSISAVDVGDEAIGETMPVITGRAFREYQEAVEARKRGEGALAGVATGIEALDRYIGGLQRGMVTIVAARPRMGKSTFGLAIADNVSATGAGVHVFSLEDTASSYHDRAIARLSGVSGQKLRAGEVNVGDLARVGKAAEILHKRKSWFVDDRAGLSAEDVVRCVRRKRRELGTEVVIVDYISKLKLPRASNVHDAMAVVSNVLANAARQDGLVYVVLSQLNRECEKRDDKRPMLGDLRASGALEEDSRCVLMLYRDSLYNPRADPGQIEILVRKNSHGESDGTVFANWSGSGFRIW